jgi:dUTP pyrophosphatase
MQINNLRVRFKKLHENAVLPSYAKPGDAGMDLTITSGPEYVNRLGIFGNDYSYVQYGFGLAAEVPEGYVGLLFPRSSQSKVSLILANCVGVLDSGFRGEITARFKIDAGGTGFYAIGDRAVQLIVIPYPNVTAEWASQLTETERGESGFGSSGA